MNRLFSFFIPIYFLLAFKLWTPFIHTDVVKDISPIPITFSKVFNENIGISNSAPMMITIVMGTNSPVCSGSTLDIHATPSSGTAPYTYAWAGPNGFTSNSGTSSIANVAPAATGTYTVTVTDFTAATATGTIAVTVNAATTVNAGPNQVLCRNTNAQLAGSFGGGASSAGWTASVGGGSFLPNPSSMNAQYDPPNNYSGNIILTLTTNDPTGPCGAVADQVLLQYGDPAAMVCNDAVFLAMDEDCAVDISPDMLLEGSPLYELYSVTIFTQQGVNLGNHITNQQVGSTLIGRVTDNCNGNICYSSIQVGDNLAPVITCQNFTVPCALTNHDPNYMRDALGIAAAIPNVIENCSNYTLTKFDTWVNLDCGDIFQGQSNLSGYIKRIWTAKDAYNNSASCTQYIYFERPNIFEIQLPLDATVSCVTMNTNPMATGVPYIASHGHQFPLYPDNGYCEISVTKVDQVVSSCVGQQSIIRTWTIFDLCLGYSVAPPANPIVYVQLINITDLAGPTLSCPTNLTVSTDALNCCATVDLPDVIMLDGCSYVSDVAAIIVSLNPFTGDTTNIQVVLGSLSSFPGNNLSIKDTLAVFPNSPCLGIGQHIVTYQGEDACGNVGTCSFRITVSDGTPPLAVCDEYTQVVLGIDGMAFVNAATFDDGSYDNCSPVNFKIRRLKPNTCQSNDLFYDTVKFCCEDTGDTIEVILRVYDIPLPTGAVGLDFGEQHFNDCIVQVYVEDRLKPVCVPPANVTVSCENFDPSLWAHGQPAAYDNCCLDTIKTTVNYNSFDTVCNKGTIIRTFRAFDCYGNSNSCTQRIIVTYEQNYFIKFPNDAIVTVCDGTGAFGEPSFYGENCELLATSYSDAVYTVVPDACYKIERTWTIINWCKYDPNGTCIYVPNPSPNATANNSSNLPGPTVSPYGTAAPWAPTNVKISSTDQSATNYSTFFDPNANCYKYKQIIKIIDGQKPTIACPASPSPFCDNTDNDGTLWNANIFVDANNGHNLCEGPADVCATGTDACSGANVSFHYLLFLDLNNDGVMETVVNSNNPPAYGTVNYGNATNPSYNGGISTPFDNRSVSQNQKYGWGLQTSTVGNNVTACIKWNTSGNPGNYVTPQFPLGNHKVKWFITDGCGNENVCEYAISVRDCQIPHVTCINGLTINMMQVGMIEMFATQFLLHTDDNCTPSNLIKIAIRKSGTGAGFPTNPNGTPQTSVSFSCAELGTQLVEIWAQDQYGNADFCETYAIVQDNAGVCGQNVTVAGAINTENGSGVEETTVQLSSAAGNGLPDLEVFNWSDFTGTFNFNHVLPMASNYVVTPLKDNDPLNGVTTYDLVLMSRHILGLEPLNTPYKLIAADINKSGTITTFDIVELRKLILGTYLELPNNASWRFIAENYTFPNLENPFVETLPENKSYSTTMQDMMEENFVAVKIGDVDDTNVPNNFTSMDERTDGMAYFEVEDQDVRPGELVTAKLQCTDEILGYQLTLQLGDVEILNIFPGEGQSEENFAMFPDKKAITSSWDGHAAPSFKVQFKSNVAAKLSDLMSISSTITKAEGYGLAAEKLDIGLRFTSANGVSTLAGVGFELYQNQPNPFLNKTVIGFHLPEAADVKLTIFDESGRTILTQNGTYSRGYNRVLIDTEKMEANASLLYYRVETPKYNATRKMIKTK
jgi:hypothetical protein